MAASTILGADPGKDGAFVLISADRAVLAHARIADLIGKLPWASAGPAVAEWVREQHATHRIDRAVLELYAGRPNQSGSLTIGAGWGLIYGVLCGLEIPTRTPTSAVVAKAMFAGVAGEGKARGIALAMSDLPDLPLLRGRERNRHDGTADAGVLALYGLQRWR